MKRWKFTEDDIKLELIGTFRCTPPPDWVLLRYDEAKTLYYKRRKEVKE